MANVNHYYKPAAALNTLLISMVDPLRDFCFMEDESFREIPALITLWWFNMAMENDGKLPIYRLD